MSKYDFQYIVIGSGPAGNTAATTLAKAKKSVAMIEGRFFGGSNLNTLDVPYAVALDTAHAYTKVRTCPTFHNHDFSLNFPSLVSRELRAAIDAGGNNRKLYEDSGVVCFNGYANFLDPHTIAVKHKQFTAANFIIATGAHLRTNEIFGLDTTPYLTPETAIKVRRLPEVIAVVGAGSTGCEIASFFAELGSQVLLFEISDRILPKEDPEASAVITAGFVHSFGVNVLTNSKVVAIGEDIDSKFVIFHHGNSEKMVRVTEIVLATGSAPNTNLGLENAKVKYHNSGIIVNKLFETSVKHIYAIGDCIGDESSTERAYQQGVTLATNLIKRTKNIVNYRGAIRLTNTYPQVATVGYSEEDLIHRDRKYKKSLVNFEEITAGKINNTYGFVKLLADREKAIIGATIVAPDAGLLAQEISLAIRHHHTAIELASTPHLINSYNQAIKLAARSFIKKS